MYSLRLVSIMATSSSLNDQTNLHLLIEAIMQNKAVCEGQTMWFHGMTRPLS